jgi:formyltetrahydrofolate deformylase
MKINPQNNRAIILLTCPDKKGLVATLSQFLFKNNGNIVYADQHTDLNTQTFYFRVEWELSGFKLGRKQTAVQFGKISRKHKIRWKIYYSEEPISVAVFVSKQTHCLHDLLSRYDEGEFACRIPLVISNHTEAEKIVRKFNIPFEYFPKPKTKESEKLILNLLEKQNIDTIVLARYMQILGENYLKRYPNRMINIHHSFLPAFIGGSPYRQAYDRGVKIIGATSHYITKKLDEGPIIEQDIIRVSHRDTVDDMRRKGKDLEKIVLARALRLHLDRRILVDRNKTLIFE